MNEKIGCIIFFIFIAGCSKSHKTETDGGPQDTESQDTYIEDTEQDAGMFCKIERPKVNSIETYVNADEPCQATVTIYEQTSYCGQIKNKGVNVTYASDTEIELDPWVEFCDQKAISDDCAQDIVDAVSFNIQRGVEYTVKSYVINNFSEGYYEDTMTCPYVYPPPCDTYVDCSINSVELYPDSRIYPVWGLDEYPSLLINYGCDCNGYIHSISYVERYNNQSGHFNEVEDLSTIVCGEDCYEDSINFYDFNSSIGPTDGDSIYEMKFNGSNKQIKGLIYDEEIYNTPADQSVSPVSIISVTSTDDYVFYGDDIELEVTISVDDFCCCPEVTKVAFDVSYEENSENKIYLFAYGWDSCQCEVCGNYDYVTQRLTIPSLFLESYGDFGSYIVYDKNSEDNTELFIFAFARPTE